MLYMQEFVEDVLNLSGGKWSSPGGDAKLYRDESQDIYYQFDDMLIHGL